MIPAAEVGGYPTGADHRLELEAVSMMLLALAGLLLVAGYTITLGIAEFRRGNHLGGVGLSVAALATMALGAYEVFFW